MKFIIVLFLYATVAYSDGSINLVADPPVGKVRGSIILTRQGKQVSSFRGIRYAEPPTGNLRFKEPVPVADWYDVFDASEEGYSCPRVGVSNISEDCLRLNVYTRNLPSDDSSYNGSTKLLPVIIFFHPGGFYGFSAQSYLFGPHYLLNHDIVLVTIQYRLGTLGFISTGDAEAPGNLGLKDQVVGLKWVQRNIASFGGDPNSVTITGDSAGSFSVILHMLSPMSKGLFHRSLAMSSSPIKSLPLPNQQFEIAAKQARLLGCPTDSSKIILDCLRTKPMEDFVNTMNDFFEWYGFPILVWSPVVEPDVPGVQRFLSGQPIDLIRLGKINHVPLICGITRDEFGGLAVGFIERLENGNTSLADEINNDWYRIAPIAFNYDRGTPRSRYISDKIREFYFKNQTIGLNNARQLGYLYGDSITIFPMHRLMTVMAPNLKAPMYVYKFTQEGKYSFATFKNNTPYGVHHQDDLQYLFYISYKFPFYGADAPESNMIDILTSIWSHYAHTAEPIPRNNQLLRNVVWDTYSVNMDNYLDLNVNPSMKNGIFPDRMHFWDELFPIPPISDC